MRKYRVYDDFYKVYIEGSLNDIINYYISTAMNEIYSLIELAKKEDVSDEMLKRTVFATWTAFWRLMHAFLNLEEVK